MTEPSDWNQYQRLVMNKLETLEQGQKEMNAHLGDLTTEMAVMKVKSGLWGFLAGTVPAAIAVAVHWFNRNK
jgi:hypothetical protein